MRPRISTFRLASSALAHHMAAATLACAAILAAVPAVKADDILVKYDQATLIRLPRPAAEVIIGNPSIADVHIQNGTSLVITGKSFGMTNLITLDAQGQVIREQRLIVRRDDDRYVNVFKGAARSTYSCPPNALCQPVLSVGDETFQVTLKQTQDKMKISEGNDQTPANQ
jgi:hypothetical protein